MQADRVAAGLRFLAVFILIAGTLLVGGCGASGGGYGATFPGSSNGPGSPFQYGPSGPSGGGVFAG